MSFETCSNDARGDAKIKCVVWDLDDTVWEGTLLEGDDVVLAPGVKSVIEELDHRGILQSIASKNEYKAAWQQLSAFGLSDYFLHPQINWGSKSDSIKAIAERLGIALNAFAFIDDQAFELAEVQHFLPEVTTVAAADLGGIVAMAGMQPVFITNESRMRRNMYQADASRQQAEAEFAGSREQFLATLDMRMTIHPATEMDLRRAEELTIRTHQLNTTGRTYSYESLRAILDSPDHLLFVAELEDRVGTSGTIGLALIERTADIWLLKLLIMSCRVMTRGVGGIMLSYVLQAAKRAGVRMRAEFIATDRNRMMYVTYKFNGFYEIETQDSFVLLEHGLESIPPYPPYVSVRSTSAGLGENASILGSEFEPC